MHYIMYCNLDPLPSYVSENHKTKSNQTLRTSGQFDENYGSRLHN